MYKNSKTFLCLIFGLLISSGLIAQKIDLTQDIPLDNQVKVGKLENGLTYYIRQNAKPEKRVELRLAINAGAMQEDENQLGLAHFTEHMLFNGTKNFAKNDLVSYLQSVGVKFGADLNAYTSFDETVYMLPIPSDNPEILEKGFQILEDWAHLATFDNEEIDKERGVVIEEWRTGRGAGQRMRDQYFPKLLKGSRYAERLPIGKKEILETFEYETIKKFYKDWYRPDLMAVVVVGDIDVNEMEQKIKAHFGNLKPQANPRPKKLYEIPDHKETIISIATDKESPFTQVQVYYKHPHKEMKTVGDYRESLAASLYSSMLSDRYNELTQQAEPPFLSAYAGYGGFLRTKDAYFTSASVGEEGIISGLKAALIENKRVLQHGFNESELERAKKSLLNRYERQYNERKKTGSDRLVSSFVANFLENDPEPGIEWEYEMVQKLLPTIAAKDINELPQKWITQENRVVIITAPDKEGVKIPTEADVMAVLTEVEAMSVEAYEDKVIDEPLMAEMPKAGTITTEKSLGTVGATELTLSNGVKVVLKPTDFKDDEILMTAFSFGGHSLVSDADYQSAVNASSIINESGIRDFSSTDLQKLLTGKTVNVSPFIGDTNEGFNGSASPKDLETMLQLVNLYFTAPRMDKTAFESYVTKQKTFLANVMKNPQFAFLDKQIKVMTQNHPRAGGIPTPEDYDKIDLDRAFKIYQERFADASDFTFVMIGNFEVDKIKPWLETYLGSLPSINRNESFKDLGIRTPEGMVSEKFEQGKDPKSQVMISFNGEYKKNEERYLMRSLAEVLTIKLIENLREEKGGVYGTRASANTSVYPYKAYGLSVSFTCAPENVAELMAAVYEEIEKVQKKGPTQEDLDKIKEAQRKDVEKNEQENRFWLNSLRTAYYENNGDVSKLTKEAQLARIDKLTGKELKKIAKKYLDMDEHITLVMNPDPEALEEAKASEQSAQSNESKTDKEALLKDMTAAKVIDRYIESIGGKEKISAVKGIVRTASIDAMGMTLSLEMAKVNSSKLYLSQSMMGQEIMKMVVDTELEKAKVVTQQGSNVVEGEDALKMGDTSIFPETDYTDVSKFKVTLEGIEMIDGQPAYKLLISDLRKGAEASNWFSTETGLMLKNENEQSISIIKEYETIDGIKFPKTMSITQKAQNMEMTMSFEETKLNPEFEEGKFSVEE